MESKLIKNIGILISGTGLSQLLVVLVQPFIRTLYTPKDFGAFSIYLSYYGILSVILSLQYEKAILLPKKDKESNLVTVLSIILIVFFSILILVLSSLFPIILLKYLHVPENYTFIIYLAPISAALFSINTSLNNRLVYQKKFKFSSFSRPIRRSSELIVQSGKSLLNFSQLLYIGDIIGISLSAIYTYSKVKLKMLVPSSELKETAILYNRFPKEYLLPYIVNTISLQLVVFLINIKFGLETLGYFDLTKQMLALPGALVSSSIALVLLQNIAENKNKKRRIAPEIIRLSKFLLPLAFVYIIVILVWGQDLFVLVFGLDWQKSGYFAQILVVGYAIKFLVSPASQILVALNKLKIMRYWQLSNFAVLLSLYFFQFENINNFLYTYLFIDIISYLVYLLLIVRSIKAYERNLF
jgi:O-antigen/teichoic acid export membrane protein